ncbi:hypothetical protein AU468_00020 [Alkalispirochaeta sphaeroplastigenens]|uniref:HTH cro/C1-type domain-containing protein n=1 Tax=Alkalispirochaeta sphaeroplastigenens TaxID=1187066 RepID=A0A2S4K1G4_9SPIO|nr:hypothetical protein AU468_00020 [Alkalispirochaeta sphaeroplastigenens]
MSELNHYPSPTPEDLRDFMRRHGLTGSQAGALLGVNGRTIRKWTGGERSMPWASWTLLQILMGDTAADEVRLQIQAESGSPDRKNA